MMRIAMERHWLWPIVLAAALVGYQSQSARAAELDPTTQAAIALFGQSLQTGQGSEGDALLRSLRTMKDPGLKPFFEALAQSHDSALRIHGILGLAELDTTGHIDLNLIAAIKDPNALNQLISAVIDAKLLGVAQAKQMLAWPGLNPSAKVLLAARLLAPGTPGNSATPGSGGDFHDKALLAAVEKSPKIGTRGLASLLLYEMGDPRGLKGLEALDASDDANRDVVRAMLLQLAVKQNFRKVRNWAYAIATEPGVNDALGNLALRVAMRFGSRAADERWEKQFTAATDPAMRMSLALTGLQLSPWLVPTMFSPMVQDTTPVIHQMGLAGEAVAGGNSNAADRIVSLIQQQYTPANLWALNYAKKHAKPNDAAMIYLGLIVAYRQGSAQDRMRRLNIATQAAQALYEQDSGIAAQLLRPVLAKSATDPMLVQGILLALVRTSHPHAADVIDGMESFTSLDADDLAALLLAKHGKKLTPNQLENLRLVIQGGSDLQDTLRIQAAWCYLKWTRQTALVLQLVQGL